jgi:hypothetical protein
MGTDEAEGRRFRFGCGFVIGILLCGTGSIAYSLGNDHWVMAFAIAGGLLFGFGAMKWGDEFWEAICRWW